MFITFFCSYIVMIWVSAGFTKQTIHFRVNKIQFKQKCIFKPHRYWFCLNHKRDYITFFEVHKFHDLNISTFNTLIHLMPKTVEYNKNCDF